MSVRASAGAWVAWGGIAAGLLAGCASSSLVNMWRDPGYNGGPLSNVVVVSMTKDAMRRRLWEDGFTSAFKKHGIDATPSYDLFADDVPDTVQLLRAIHRNGYDGLVFTHRVGSQVRVHYVPGYTEVRPVTWESPWTGAYYTSYRQFYYPGYHEADRVVRYQVDVWTTGRGGRMIWSGVTESIDPTSNDQIAREISKLIIPQLEKQNVIAATGGS